MGFSYRKSKSLGKNTRLNVSNKSVGISTGMKGMTASINSKGRSSINLSIPGTGLRYRKTFGKKDAATGIVMFCVMGFMNLMIYLMQVCFILTWWAFKVLVWMMYYFFVYSWKLCKFTGKKLIELVSYIITLVKKSKSQDIISATDASNMIEE